MNAIIPLPRPAPPPLELPVELGPGEVARLTRRPPRRALDALARPNLVGPIGWALESEGCHQLHQRLSALFGTVAAIGCYVGHVPVWSRGSRLHLYQTPQGWLGCVAGEALVWRPVDRLGVIELLDGLPRRLHHQTRRMLERQLRDEPQQELFGAGTWALTVQWPYEALLAFEAPDADDGPRQLELFEVEPGWLARRAS